MNAGDIATVVSILLLLAGVIWFFVAPKPATLVKIYVVPTVLVSQAGLVMGIVEESVLRGLAYAVVGAFGAVPMFGILEAAAGKTRRVSRKDRRAFTANTNNNEFDDETAG